MNFVLIFFFKNGAEVIGNHPKEYEIPERSNRINKHSKIFQKSDVCLNEAWGSKLNHTPKSNPNCHIQSIKTNIATKAMQTIFKQYNCVA